MGLKERKKFIVFILIAIGGVLMVFLLQQNYYRGESLPLVKVSPQEPPQEEETVPEKSKGPTNKSGIEIPEKVYTYQGEITEKRENGFVLKVSAIDNPVEEDQVMDIRVDGNTRFVRLVVITPKTEGEKTQTRTEAVTLADVAVGERVTITAYSNVRGETSFLAESVRAVVEE